MSHFLDRLHPLHALPKETFSGDHGVATGEDRTWEDAYRNRWAHDKIVRSTHGVNCTGSLLLEDLRQGRHRHLGNPADRLPAHALGHAQPRAARLRARRQLQLVPVQRQPRQVPDGARPPARALARGAEGDARRRSTPGPRSSRTPRQRRDYQKVRGMGGFVRSSWDEVNQLIAAANVYTIKKHGPDRVIGFSARSRR